jgi:hypothetical protein
MTNKYLLSLSTGASYELDGETPDASFSLHDTGPNV